MLKKTRKYRRLVEACVEIVGLPKWGNYEPAEWLEGLILTESAGDPKAVRYEPHQDRAWRKGRDSDPDTPDHDDGITEDDKSYGLMQVMGYNIRWLTGVPKGVKMDYSWSLLPIANISLGLRILKYELSAVGGDISRALARYNGGPTGDDLVGVSGSQMMRRQVYVDKVAANTQRVHHDVERVRRENNGE